MKESFEVQLGSDQFHVGLGSDGNWTITFRSVDQADQERICELIENAVEEFGEVNDGFNDGQKYELHFSLKDVEGFKAEYEVDKPTPIYKITESGEYFRIVCECGQACSVKLTHSGIIPWIEITCPVCGTGGERKLYQASGFIERLEDKSLE